MLPPISIPFTDKRGIIDRNWLRFLQDITTTSSATTGFVVDGSATTYGTMTLFQGLAADRGAAPANGAIYFALDTGQVFFSSGGAWLQLTEELTGDVLKSAGSTVTSLAEVFPSPGDYGSPTQVPILTIDSKGRVTNVDLQPVAPSVVYAAGDDTEVQFNDGGFLEGSSFLFYNKLTGGLSFTYPKPTREALSPLTTKGDIFVRDGTESTRLPVGTDGQVLRANSATALGVEWADDETVEVRFNFGDATPKPIATIPANKVVTGASITILTPFDDPTATLALGNTTDLQETTDNLPSEAGTYTTTPGIQYATPTACVLSITAGTSTQGSGLVTITLEE